MPNFKCISFKMTVLQGGRTESALPMMCYPKDPMWNRVKGEIGIVQLITSYLIHVFAFAKYKTS